MFCDDAQALLPTAVMQPATFAIEYALARLWMEQYGIRPVAMVGHSVGELAAANLAGVFTLPDAMRLVAHRGRQMQAPLAGRSAACRGVQECRRQFKYWWCPDKHKTKRNY